MGLSSSGFTVFNSCKSVTLRTFLKAECDLRNQQRAQRSSGVCLDMHEVVFVFGGGGLDYNRMTRDDFLKDDSST